MCLLCEGRDFETDGVGLSALMRGGITEATAATVFRAGVSEGADVAANTGTRAEMAVGDLFDGALSSAADRDWVGVDLVAGDTYVFSLWGAGGGISGLTDPVLTLRDGTGAQITRNDDLSEDNRFSVLEYTATQSGTYFLEASAAVASFVNNGAYRLHVATDVFDVDDVALQLTEVGWGVATSIHFDVQAGDRLSVNLTGLTQDGQQLARWALEVWEQTSGLRFAETSGAADITFDDNQSGAFAGPSSFYTESGEIISSIVNVSTSWIARYGTEIDSYSFLTYLHEIGHALGLAHAGHYNGSVDYGVDNHYLNDSYQMSIMSYFDIGENTAVQGADYRPVTPMIADFAAIETLYGASDVFAEDTVWGVGSTVGGVLGQIMEAMFEGTSASGFYDGGAIGLTIVDRGGRDVIDVSGLNMDQVIDLREGGVSSVAGWEGNLLIAQGSVIEGAIGGAGDDLLIGNGAGNAMFGGAGQNRLDGQGGNDTLHGGTGADQLLGRDGHDVIWGFDGNDTIAASDGNDTVEGEAGHDSIGGGYGDDHLRGNSGNDVIGGGSGRDLVEAGTGHDVASGGWGYDTVLGGAGHDTLAGSYDADEVQGGLGDDSIGGGTGDDTIHGGDGNDVIGAGLQDDLVFGEAGADFLAGGEGADSLYGGAGADVLNGGYGNDWLYGGGGADVFVFTALGDGRDHIADFEDGADILRLPGADFGALHLIETDEGTEVSSADYTLVLLEMDVVDLDVGDFLFV